MSLILKSLRALADPTRLRLLVLLQSEELSVNELQEITRLGQSRISTHLRQLQEADFLESRRAGKRTFYKLKSGMGEATRDFNKLAHQGALEISEHDADQVNLRRILARREDKAQVFFNEVAGRFDRSYGPGRSWQAFGQMLLRMLPPVVVADMGAGEGLLSELLARSARKVIAVDNSEKIVDYGASKARKSGLKNLEFRLGDLEDPPISARSVDLVVLSQALHHAVDPVRAIKAAYRMLRSGGQILILDLRKHQFEQAKELYGDLWLGFAESDLHRWLEEAGFLDLEITMVAREDKSPHFETILAVGQKGGGANCK